MNINDLMGTLSAGYYARQVLAIIVLSLAGWLLLWLLRGGYSAFFRGLLAFPAGLSYFAVLSFILLGTGIRFSPVSVSVLAGAGIAIAFLLFLRRGKESGESCLKQLAFFLPAVVLGALVCCSGILSVGIDNDSVFFYSSYPQILAKEGAWRPQFDMYLTNVGPVAAIINTLPFLFGFSQTFGIQHFLNLNFLLVFGFCLKEKTESRLLGLSAVLYLATLPAFLVTAKWVMAGDYFMIFFFLLFAAGEEAGGKERKPFGADRGLSLVLFSSVLSLVRQEGSLFVMLLAVCFSALYFTSRQLMGLMVLPSLLMLFLYYARIYLILGIRPEKTFLTPAKASMILAMCIASGIYVLAVQKVLLPKRRRLALLLPVLLLFMGNILMLFLNPHLYLANLHALVLNIWQRNGWGYFGIMAFLALCLVLFRMIQSRSIGFLLSDAVLLSFLLAVLAACFARGDALQLGIGDSGNRLMLTAVPMVVYAMLVRLFVPMDAQDRKEVRS